MASPANSDAPTFTEPETSTANQRVLPVGPVLFRTVTNPEVARVLALHIRRRNAPVVQRGPDAPAFVDFSRLQTLPHFARNGELLVDTRKRIVLTLQLKTNDSKFASIPLVGESFLHGVKMKLALAPAERPTRTFVSSRFSQASHDQFLPTDADAIFSGATDATGSFALAEIDVNGIFEFDFRLLLLSQGRRDRQKFLLKASPVDPHLQSPQLTWYHSNLDFEVKSQVRRR